MGCEIALHRAWNELESLSGAREYTVQLLGEDYLIDVARRQVLSQPSQEPANDYLAVILLHYLAGMKRCGYRKSGEWVTFRDIRGGESYFPAYQNNTVRPLVEALQRDPDALVERLLHRFGGRMVDGGDLSVELTTFPGIDIRLIMWLGDDELPAEATVLFDRALTDIYCTEDIAVFLDVVVRTAVCRGMWG
ncbi:MAG: DUF3786 domain-containing protein [Methanosarcinales archaeon]|nr:DUF3786 domain-containing protein [Methanosarcinales archaeon]